MKTKSTATIVFTSFAFTATLALAATYNSDLLDGWSKGEVTTLSSLHISHLGDVPADPSNAYEKLPAAVDLGRQLFFDARLSSNGKVSCASCHSPDKNFQDGLALGLGVGTGMRRTMPIVGAGYSAFLFWDGRKDSAWSQALGPLEDHVEHGGTRLAYAHLINTHYRTKYEKIFGSLPALSGLPKEAGPFGTASQKAAWEGISEGKRHEVSRVFANIGKAIATYEKTLEFGPSRLDKYIEGVVNKDPSALGVLDASEKAGLRIFIGKGQCVTCHNGPLLTDQHFHNTGIAPRLTAKPDLGRSAAIEKVISDEFNCLGKFSDAKPEQCGELQFIATDDHAMVSAFKTPSLRSVASRAPYMHAGQVTTLNDVVAHYNKAPDSAAGHSELKPLKLSQKEIESLLKFLDALSSPVVQKDLH